TTTHPKPKALQTMSRPPTIRTARTPGATARSLGAQERSMGAPVSNRQKSLPMTSPKNRSRPKKKSPLPRKNPPSPNPPKPKNRKNRRSRKSQKNPPLSALLRPAHRLLNRQAAPRNLPTILIPPRKKTVITF